VSAQRIKLIEQHVHDAMPVSHMQVEDESHLHAGHEGAKSGLGHFSLLVVSEIFADMSPLQRHRLINQAMGNLFKTDIHALTIQAMTQVEYDAMGQSTR